MSRFYPVRKFAGLAGVTVRTLHYYDRLGLLQPVRNEAGYRCYQLRDLERLEQIVALRFLGLPLKRIRILLDQGAGLSSALRMQREVLEEKRRLLDRAIQAISDAERAIRPGKPAESTALKRIIEAIAMQNDTNWTRKYYTEEAWAKIEERKGEWSPELQERISQQWTDLFRDVEAALGEDPAGQTAQALAQRWQTLVEAFTGADPGVTSGLKQLYADRPNWPSEFQQQMTPFGNPRVWEFMNQVLACRKE